MPFIRRHFTPPSLRFRTFLRANRFFLIGVLLLILYNAYLVFTNQQGDELIAINRLRTDNLDWVFIVGTQLGEPIAYVAVIIGFLCYRIRTAIFVALTGGAVGIITGLLKLYFAEARPMRWFFDNFEATWHNLNLFDESMRNWGDTSFPSGHSASAFALFSFVSFNVRRPKILVSILCFLLATEVAFSRMYLLYHFLRDVTAGAFLGLVIAIAMYFLQWKLAPDNRLLNDGLGWTSTSNLPASDERLHPDTE
ncbi:membrane-associated phospholipid phosphatase [Neolewinella xylanilytica]|uniref:Membrane-associated phospholipid phosphatase n=1 Tax=Neolewinella xylanilytica TaxID=1514080 RepID=A0A2S6I6E4_9BACT|nr:phosphatase PAP2 family protein [Neolewinella xylanilytica]PPK86709.1 membrane-associated phospholipid phosphatase [Neolewinella xylanilytica]